MSLQPKITIAQNLITGGYFTDSDSTGAYSAINNPGGYGGPNIQIGDVQKTRFLFSSYLKEQEINTNVTYCYPSVEYEVYGSGSGNVTVNTKVLSSGDVFILQVDAEPNIGEDLYIRETGRFAILSSFIPSSMVEPFSSVNISPAECGIDSLVFPDSACRLSYEVYAEAFGSGPIDAGTYIVMGTLLVNTAIINGVTYNVGEVITIDSSTSFTGTAELSLLQGSTYLDFPLYYHAWQTKIDVENVYVDTNCSKSSEYRLALSQIQSRIEAIDIMYEDELNNDASLTQTLLDNIQTLYQNLTQNVPNC